MKKTPPLSILREEQYKKISELELHGKILDLAGSKNSGYHELMQGCHEIITVNLDPENYPCDLLVDIEKPFPFENGSYDHVLAINVLEHIFNFKNVITESFRVMKPRGTVVYAVPFFHHVHGSPDDYFRYTASALHRLLVDSVFRNVEVQELGSGILSANFTMWGGALPRFVQPTLKKIFVGIDTFLMKRSKRFRDMRDRIPLGYFITATK